MTSPHTVPALIIASLFAATLPTVTIAAPPGRAGAVTYDTDEVPEDAGPDGLHQQGGRGIEIEGGPNS